MTKEENQEKSSQMAWYLISYSSHKISIVKPRYYAIKKNIHGGPLDSINFI